MIRLGLLVRKSQLLTTFISPSLGFIGLWTNQTEIISLLAGSVSLRYSKQMHSKRLYIFIESLTSITDWWDFFFFNLPEEINSCCILYISNVDIVSLAMLSEYDLGRGQKDMKIDLSGEPLWLAFCKHSVKCDVWENLALCIDSMCISWTLSHTSVLLSVCQLDRNWRNSERPSARKIPPSDWPVCFSLGHFLDY